MSCEYHQTATFEGIKKFLDFDNDDGDCTRNALQNFKIALSPTREILVFAKGTWLLICELQWKSSVVDDCKIQYSPKWNGHINCKPDEEITTIFCMPFISQSQNNFGNADWTCIVVGFSSGYIRFYNEEMQELACSIFHEETVLHIKCYSPTPLVQGGDPKLDNNDIYVLHNTVFCIINKSQLLHALNNKRNELVQGLSKNKSENYLTVDFKKYSFVGQDEVTDACFLGQTPFSSFSTFDHLVTASLVGGFNSNYKSSPPQTSLIITSGKRPFVGFHYTLEGTNNSILTDVALTVASKIRDSVAATLPDWFSFRSKKPSTAEKPKELSQDFAERLSCRFGLCDLWREGQSVIVSPDGAFSAVTDSFGRVLLINNSSGIAHRLWKGYRNAQCGFIQVQEDVKKLKKSKEVGVKHQLRQGLFLVIYAPRKELIEVFTTQNGQLVTSVKVAKKGRLIYLPQMGSNVSWGGFKLCQYQVIFISEDGFSEFFIPFHCALAEDNSKISRDLHILKRIKMLLKTEKHSEKSRFIEDIGKCAQELKTTEVRLLAIEYMITYKNVTLEALKIILKVFLESSKNEERLELASTKIITFADITYNFVLLFEFLINEHAIDSKECADTNSVNLSEELRLQQEELDIILKFIQQIVGIEKIKQRKYKVAFGCDKRMKFAQFLFCFDFEFLLNSLNKKEKQEELKGSEKCILKLKTNGKESVYGHLGEIFFQGIFNCKSSFENWKIYIKNSCLNPRDIALCLLSYWCDQQLVDNFFSEVVFFLEIMKFICSLNDPSTVVAEYNVESPWWREIRGFIAGNAFTLRGLLAALCCRSVTIFMEQEKELRYTHKSSSDKKSKITEDSKEKNTSETTTFNDWESLSKDVCEWDILIMQLQDIALLNAVLSLTFKTETELPEIPFDFERQSLASIQSKGTGGVSELVAKWLVQFGFEPLVFIDKNDVEFQVEDPGKERQIERFELILAIDKANESKLDENVNRALEYLGLLKSRFPYSLTSSSLVSNICWEYFAYWFTHVSDIKLLEAGLLYLKAVPIHQLKYGISYLAWNTHLEPKFDTLSRMINRIGKVPRDKLCAQEIGLRSDQVPSFLQIVSEILSILLSSEMDDKPNVDTNREAVWQSSCPPAKPSLVSLAMSQPNVNGDLISFQLELCYTLLLMSSLHIKQQKIFSFLFDNMEKSSFLHGASQLNSHYQNLKLKESRSEFLKKCIAAAVQTVELVEHVPPISSDNFSDIIPTTKLEVESYRKWLQLCFELAGMWAIPLDDLRKHQILELYANGFDRLAEEVIPSVNDTSVLASQLLVLGGKRLKYYIQESGNFSKKSAELSANLSEWLHILDLENFTYNNSVDDIEVLMRYIAKWLPEDHLDHKLALTIIESLSFLKAKN